MWPNPQFPGDLVSFTEENLNGKLHFFSSEIIVQVHSEDPSKIEKVVW